MLDLIMIVGPTATGKSKLAIELAKNFNGEVINGDAFQFYKGLDIGTAKIKDNELEGVTHHLLSFLEPSDRFNVATYQELVREKINLVKAKKKTPIIVGGSGLYLNSIYYDYQFFGDERNDDLVSNYDSFNNDELFELLREKNQHLAEITDRFNRRRLIRALEKTDDAIQTKLNEYYNNSVVIALNMPREELYKRINSRVDKMINDGLVQEVRKLFDKQIYSQAIQAIGYKELYRYFNQEINLLAATELIKKNSRNYAKRQLTWFKNKINCHWIIVDNLDFKKTVEEATLIIKKEVSFT